MAGMDAADPIDYQRGAGADLGLLSSPGGLLAGTGGQAGGGFSNGPGHKYRTTDHDARATGFVRLRGGLKGRPGGRGGGRRSGQKVRLRSFGAFLHMKIAAGSFFV